MNNTTSLLASLAVTAMLVISGSAQGQCGQESKSCCKTSPATTAGVKSTSSQPSKKTNTAALFNEICPVTGLPTSATTPSVEYAGYAVSLCCANCIPLFANLDEAKKTSFLAAYTGKNRRVAFPATTGTVSTAKGACGDCSQDKGKSKATEACAGGACKGDNQSKTSGKGKPKTADKGANMKDCAGQCGSNATANGSGQGKGQGKGKGRGQGQGKGRGMGMGQGRGMGRGMGMGQGKGKGGAGQGSCQDTGLAGRTTKVKVPASYMTRLQETLVEELYARDYYKKAEETLGGRRFGNLARAEQHHADAIIGVITYLGGKPVVAHDRKIEVPKTVAESEKICQEIELLVIKVYDGLIKDCPDPALLNVFNRIQSANRRHLNAVGGK